MDSKKLIADVSKCFNESIDRSEGVILCYLEGPDCAPLPYCYQHMDDFEEAKKLCDQMNKDHVDGRKYAIWDKSLSEQFYPPVESKHHRDDEYHIVLHDDGTPKGKPVAIFATITGDLDRAKKACKLHNASSKRHFMTVRTLLDNGEFSEPLFPIEPKDFPKRFRETNEAAEEKPEAYAVCRREGDKIIELGRFRTFERARTGCDMANKYSEVHPGAFVVFAVVNGEYGEKVHPEAVNESEEPDYEDFDDYKEFIDQAKDGAFDGYRIVTANIEDGWGGLRLLLKDEDNNLLEVFVKNHDLKDADAWLADCGRRNIDGVITHTDEQVSNAVEYTIALCTEPNEPPCREFGTIDDFEQAKKIVDYMNAHGKRRKEGIYGVYTIHNNEYSKVLYPINTPEADGNGAPINEKAMYELNWPEQYNHDVLGQLAKHSDLKNKFEQTSDHSIKFAHDDSLKQQFIDYLKAEKCDEKDLMINEINESKDDRCEVVVSPHFSLKAQEALNSDPEIKSKIEWTAANSFKFKCDDNELFQKITDALINAGIEEEEFMAQELDEASASKKVNEAEEENDLQKLNKFLNDYFQTEFKFEGRWGKQIEFDTESTLRYRGIDAEDLSNKAAEAMGEKIDPDSISVQKNSITVIVTDKFNDGMERFDLSTITKENMPEILKFDELKELIEDEFGYKVAVLAVNDKKFEFESDNIKAEAGVLKDIFKDLRVSSSNSLITTNPKTGKLNAYAGINFAWEFADHGFNGHSIGNVRFEDGKWILRRY